ncbi:MAG: sugar transferase [Eubacteriales bacterium]|nr:sugar transferase [Eubacteriales bacterium]
MKDFINIDGIEDTAERRKVISTLAVIRERNKRGYWVRKRGVDFVLSLTALIVLAVPMAVIAVIIFAQDGAWPFYGQTRVGRRGKTFKMYKFRTMVPNADKLKRELMDKNEMDGPVFKIKDDPRITKIGGFLRKTSIDELPQFYNVLKGDMCIIGPRPPLPEEVAQYTEYQKIRLLCTPGITCTWQVAPKRNDISFEEWVEMDVDYVINRSLLMDIKIVFKTALVMLSAEGR